LFGHGFSIGLENRRTKFRNKIIASARRTIVSTWRLRIDPQGIIDYKKLFNQIIPK
jgi:hypothetical protein